VEVGAVTESVTADAASPQVNAEDAQLAPQWDHLKSTANAPKRTISFWMAPVWFPKVGGIALDWSVTGFTLALSLATGI